MNIDLSSFILLGLVVQNIPTGLSNWAFVAYYTILLILHLVGKV